MPSKKENYDLKSLFAEQRGLHHKKGIPEFGAMWNKAEKMRRNRQHACRQKAGNSGFIYRAVFATACAVFLMIVAVYSPVRNNSWDAQFVSRAEAINNWKSPTASLMPSDSYMQNASAATIPAPSNWKTPTDFLFDNETFIIERNQS